MNDNHIKMNVTPCDLDTGAHITHIYINQTPDNLSEKSLDTKLFINGPVEFNKSNSTFVSKESSSLYSNSINDGRDVVVNNATPYEYSKVIQSSQLRLDDNGSYSCHISVNENAALNSVCETINTEINTDTIRPLCNADTNFTYLSSEDDESYGGYSIADISDIDDLSDNILNDRQSSPLREQIKVQTNGSSHVYNSSVDSETDGILMFLDKSNNEVSLSIIIINLLIT